MRKDCPKSFRLKRSPSTLVRLSHAIPLCIGWRFGPAWPLSAEGQPKTFLTHHLQKGPLELVHFLRRADRDADVSGPARPDAADVNLFLAERFHHALARLPHVEHELVRHRRHVRKTVPI